MPCSSVRVVASTAEFEYSLSSGATGSAMGWLDAAEGLLSGPRGRRQCWTLLDAGDHPGWARVRQETIAGDQPACLDGRRRGACRWRTTTIEDERSARKQPKDPSASWGGYWWSALVPSRLLSTTRSIPGLGAVGLALIEDGFGQRNARCWPVEPRPGARIYEISSPENWAEMVGRYPVDVSKSRRHNWWRVTGWAGRWLIPDFEPIT